MSKIPYNTERAVPQAQGLSAVPVAVADTSAVPEATAKLGNSLAKVGEAALEIKDRQDKFNYSIAYSKFLQKSIEYQNNLEQDPDYINAPQKYKEGLAEIKAQSLKELGSNSYAENLKEHMNLYETKNYGKVLENTTKKQSAASLAAVDQEVNNNFEAFARTKDPEARFGLLASSVLAFSNALSDTDPNKALKVQEFTDKIEKRGALLDLSQRPPQEQIALLNQENSKSGSNITKYLTPEERMEATERAQQALKQSQEQSVAAIRNADFLAKRNAENNAMNVILKGGTAADIPLEQYAKLDESTRNNLTKIQQIKNGSYQIDPIKGSAAYNKYADMYANSPTEFAKVDPITIQAEVSPDKVDEVNKWHQAAAQGIPQNNAEKNFNATANFYITKILKTKDFSSDKATMFIDKFRAAKQSFVDEKGKQPNMEELRKIANGLVAQESIGGTLFGTNDKRNFELTGKESVPDEEKTKILKEAQAINPDIALSEDQIKQIYFRKLSKKPIQ